MRRLLYFAYYVKNSNFKDLNELLAFSSQTTQRSKAAIVTDIIKCAWKYNISFEDYFLFKFFEHTEDSYRKDWIGTGFMYEYQKMMNPPSVRSILSDKFLFLRGYQEFIRRQWLKVDPSNPDLEMIEKIMNLSEDGRFVVKSSTGQAGGEVKVLDVQDYEPQEVVSLMEALGFDLLEEAVVQHPELMRLAPDGLNTVRIITQLDAKGEVQVLKCRMRLTSGGRLDNFHQGGFVVIIDMETGKIISEGFYRDPREKTITQHPATGVNLLGFQVPNWGQALDMCKEAALKHPENRTVGWDVAVRPDGVELIEGNHNWGYATYQIPLQKGLKPVLLAFEQGHS